jgi:hypothetical protein
MHSVAEKYMRASSNLKCKPRVISKACLVFFHDKFKSKNYPQISVSESGLKRTSSVWVFGLFFKLLKIELIFKFSCDFFPC